MSRVLELMGIDHKPNGINENWKSSEERATAFVMVALDDYSTGRRSKVLNKHPITVVFPDGLEFEVSVKVTKEPNKT